MIAGAVAKTKINPVSLSVKVLSAQAIIYVGTASAVSSFNDKGRFDILPYHSNFISLIKDEVIVYETTSQKRLFKIKTGVLKVFQGRVLIFVGLEG